MPWYDKYFFQIYWSSIALIFALSGASYASNNKPKKAKFKVEIEYKDTTKIK